MDNLKDFLSILEESESFLNEQAPKVEVEHTGILEIPEGKSFNQMPIKHFRSLMKRKGRAPVMRALLNLERWNKGREGHAHVAAHARKIINALKEED